jgi:sister-chromatid-cohesion protein PDS5
MADILSQLLDESHTVPQDVVEILLAHFVPKHAVCSHSRPCSSSHPHQKHRPPSYLLAATVCNASSDRLQRYVSQYFTDIFTSSSEQLAAEGELDLDELEKAHDLIKELNRVVPGVLLNVIPQLEAELQAEHVGTRTLAIKSLGKMFAEASGTVDHLAKRFPAAWRSWLGRSKDKVTAVRVAMIEQLKDIWTAHGDLSDAIQGASLLPWNAVFELWQIPCWPNWKIQTKRSEWQRALPLRPSNSTPFAITASSRP